MNATAPRDLRIGEVAARVGVSTRTLRYYQELGLMTPSGHSPGGNRRYSEADLARVERIRRLQAVLGFDLDRIKLILAAEDRLAELRDEVGRGISRSRHREIVIEADRINHQLQDQLADKFRALQEFADEISARSQRLQRLATDLDITLPDRTTTPA